MDLLAAVPGLASLQTRSLGDPGVRVAVLDGPIDHSHSCFRGASLRQLNTLVQEVAGPGRMSRHGTHVTSLIFGQPGSSVLGVAPRCQGLVVPVFQDFQEGRLPQLDLARAIEQAVLEGAHVINISGGERSDNGQADPILSRALRLCSDNNVLVVAAAGNDGCACLHVPAAVPSVLAVGALGQNGQPLATSNWGDSYRGNGVVAPGERISGAVPGGGTAEMTGTSFATPVVAGIAALLLSTQVSDGEEIDPGAVGEAIVRTAATCLPYDAGECQRYLGGAIDIQRAYAYINSRGRTAVADSNGTAGPSRVAEAGPGRIVPAAQEAALPGVPQQSERADVAAAPASTVLTPQVQAGFPSPAPEVPPGYAVGTAGAGNTAGGHLMPHPYPAPVPMYAPAFAMPVMGAPPPPPYVQSVTPASADASGGVQASDNCSCRSRPSAPSMCDCQTVRTSYVYALGNVGFDFGTEARRDTFRQLMPDVERREGDNPPISVAPNPYDVFQLVDYLETRPSESTKLIWTLNLDLTPIYAVEAEVTYPEDVYATLREALRAQALPNDDPAYVSRVSIPGMLTTRTVQLFSGQTVPVVVAQPRGLYRWAEARLVDGVIAALGPTLGADMDEEYVRRTIRTFLDKVYFETRNLGQAPSERALNFAATNAYQFGSGIADGFLSGTTMVPGAERELYTLDSIDVTKSPYCRLDSDCWDVRITFFDPVNDRRAKSVYQFTIDVSDVLPVTLAPAHRYLTT